MLLSRTTVFSGAVALTLASLTQGAIVTKGTLCTSNGAPVYDDQLASWIDSLFPNSNRLVVLTECYGGDKTDNFAGQAKTSVISATSPGQTAKYGGYDDDAANALKPGAGRTGNTVHNAGTTGKHASETPTTGGGLAPGSFDLQDTAVGGAVESRHVLVYAGQPDATPGRDVTQRDTIKSNFAGKVNTTVTTVGGPGGGGWDKPGTAKDLKKALDDIKTAIDGSPNPSKEQFILFATDHGDKHKVETAPPAPVANTTTIPSFPTFSSSLDIQPSDLIADPFNQMSFSFFLDFNAFGITHNPSTPYFSPGMWQLSVDNGSGPVFIPSFFDVFVELDGPTGPDVVGDSPGEGVRVTFPVPENFMISSFFDVFTEITITDNSGSLWGHQIGDFSQDSGNVSKLPEPGSMLVASIGLLLLGRRRRA